jgi:iron complex outermembrane receptor protein
MYVYSGKCSPTPLALAIRGLAIPLGLSAASPVAAQMEAIEEVVVTATRRSESIQDIPLNISAVSGDAIRSQGLTNLSDVMQWVPGVHIVDQGSRAADTIVVRGLNANPISASEALNNSGGDTVSTYVGEIPLYLDLKLNDMERVEVLLGPQGTLYGAGTLGGAIRYIPNKPQFDGANLELRGDLYQISEADDLSSDTGLTLNLPLGDTLAVRFNVDYLDDSGFVDYVYTVREAGVSNPDPDFSDPADVRANLRSVDDADDEQTLSGRAALRWEPSDRIDATFTYYLQDQETGGRTINSRRALGIGKYESGLRFVEPNERKNELYSLELTADLGFAELTSASGYSEYEEEGQRDQTDLLITLEYSYEAFPSFSAFTRENVDEERINQEVRLVSTGAGPLRWIAGAFYNQFEGDAQSREFTPGFDQFAVDNLGGVGLRPDSLEYFSVDRQELTEWAFFGELSYDITDRWAVTVGARYYDYDLQLSSAVDFPLLRTVYFGEPPDSIVLDFEDTGQRESGNLIKLNTAYDLNEDMMVYFTYSEGYRIGSGNGVAPCPDFVDPDTQLACALPDELDYQPDETKNYELGIRSTWLDQRLTLNGAVYYVDWVDPQLASTTENAALPITVNGEGAESTGVEFSFNWLLGERFSLRGSYSYTQAELTADAPELLSTVTPPGFAILDVDGRDGDRLPGSPEHQGNLYASYVQPLGDMDLTLNYGITAVSDVLSKTGGRANGEALPGYAVHNFSAALEAGNWDITLYAQNLTDKYAVTGLRSDRAYLQTVADINGDPVNVRRYYNNIIQPRTIGLRATYFFDM